MQRYLSMLAYREFALLWVGSTISALGDSLTWIALVWLVYDATGSAGKVGLLVVVYTAPVIIGGLLAGVALDRFNRRRVLIVDNVIRGAVMAAIPSLFHLDLLRLWHLYVVAGVYGSMKMLSLAGVPTVIPGLVPEEHLNTANALESISYGIAAIVGPGVGALLIARIGGANVLLIDAATYYALVACLLGVSSQSSPQPTRSTSGLGPAVAFVLMTPAVLTITVMFAAANVGIGMLEVVLPVYAREVLRQGVSTYGLLVSAMGVGSLLGAVLVGGLASPQSLGRAIAAAQLCYGLSFLGLLFTPHLPVTLTVLSGAGVLGAPLTVWAQTVRMRLIPWHLRGRVFGLLRTVMQAAPPLGGALGGILVTGRGIPFAVVVIVVAVGGAGALGLVVRSLAREYTIAPAQVRSERRG